MSSSYKPALLKAIVRIVRAGAEPAIPLLRIGSQFVKLYWVQTVVFRLRQAATIISEPEVVRRIRSAADMNGARTIDVLPPAVRERLDREMARVLTINVLQAFHRSKPASMGCLFEWSPGSEFIIVPNAAMEFVRLNARALESIANLWWARWLEKVNVLAPLVIEKVERDGAERASLTKYLRVLLQIDEPKCFYCRRALNDGLSTHVDHVIPWSFLLEDPLWDLVLACANCNIAKSDTLPRRDFIDKLAQTGLRRAKITLPPGFISPLLAREEIDRYYEAALSVEWPVGWAPAPNLAEH
jgi:hypothetical protein